MSEEIMTEQPVAPAVPAAPTEAESEYVVSATAPETAGDEPVLPFAEPEPETMLSMIDEVRRDVHGIYTILEHFENEFFKPKPVRQRRKSTNGRRKPTNGRKTRYSRR